jgi:hypothetical protein
VIKYIQAVRFYVLVKSQPRCRSSNKAGERCFAHSVAKLRASSCIIDGEAVACGEDGIACFELLLVRWDADGSVFLYAFDLIELDGDDLRHYYWKPPAAPSRLRPGPI